MGKRSRSSGAAMLKSEGLISVDQLDRDMINEILAVADGARRLVREGKGSCDVLKGKILANVFYEASTRTMCSFAAAMLRLGGTVVPVVEASSSAQKGETLSDTVRCLECYADVLVLRHPAKGSAKEAASASSKPVLNAGDGTGEHPTQALLDLYTMRAELGSLEGLVVTMVGDLKHGRTVHSLVRLCALHGMAVHLVSPPSLQLPEDVLAAAAARAPAPGWRPASVSDSLESVLPATDVLYVTRVQKERFASEAEYEAVKDAFVVSKATLAGAKERMVVMHPLPRVNEISTDVDADPRAVYFKQMEYGMFVRMALLAMAVDEEAAAALRAA